MRTCKKCGVEQPLDEFETYACRGKTYRRHRCITCRRKHYRDRYWESEEVREKAKRRSHDTRLERYGVTHEDVKIMHSAQDGRCAICEKEFEKTPHIDHCHESGQVRGLLCWHCNAGLGLFRDNVEVLGNAISYLEETTYETC